MFACVKVSGPYVDVRSVVAAAPVPVRGGLRLQSSRPPSHVSW